MVTIRDSDPRVLALAPGDPFDVRTFSGLSARLLGALRAEGVEVEGMATRILRPTDVLTAPNWRGFLRGELRGRRAPRIDPDWYWSRRGFERFNTRVAAALARRPATADVTLQVGTHVAVRRPGLTYCLTDATVVQALDGDSFSVSRGRGSTAAEAVENQHEVFASCTRVLVLSEWAAASVRDDYGVPAERVVVLGAGSNIAVGDEPPTPAGERAHRVLFVGLDWEQKGGPLVLEAFRAVRERVPDAVLTVVGCTPPADEPGVEVVGRLDPRDPATAPRLLDLYRRARVFTIAPDFDAFPNVLLEAGAHGAVVVSTDRGSRPEVVVDGRTGLLAPHGDAAALADRLVEALTDDPLATTLAGAARERVRTELTWPAVARRFLDVVRADREVTA